MEIFKVICGSKLYGLETPESDTDYGIVLLETPSQIFGIQNADKISQKITDETDENIHYLKRFCYLAARCNPNVLEWLWAPPSKILYADEDFQELILNRRRMFVGVRNLYRTHLGFASAQIKKLQGKNPVVGASRRAIIDKYGYDIKYAAHALRLLSQLMDYFYSEQFQYPFVEDVRDAIMVVKTGQIEYAEFLRRYEILKKAVENKYAILQNGPLALEPNYDEINKSLTEFYKRKFNV